VLKNRIYLIFNQNFRASRKLKEPRSNGINGLYTRSSTRGITQVPQQISSINMDHEMDDEDEIDHDDEDNHTGTDNDQQQPSSPTITNRSDEPIELSHIINNNNDDDEQQQNQPPSIITSTHQRKRMLPLTNHRRPPSSSMISSAMDGKSDLLSVRTHLEKGKNLTHQEKEKKTISFFSFTRT